MEEALLTDKLFKKRNLNFALHEINLENASNNELLEISETMDLALSIEEMQRIKNYFKEKRRKPTDVELQALGQAWSEHCCYKSSKIPLKQHIYGIEENKIVAHKEEPLTLLVHWADYWTAHIYEEGRAIKQGEFRVDSTPKAI